MGDFTPDVPARGPVPAAVLALLSALVVSGPANADQGGHVLSAGVAYDQFMGRTSSSVYGTGAQISYAYGIADDWDVFATASYAAYLGPGPWFDAVGLQAGAAYVLDVTEWIPRLHAGVGYFGPGTRPGLKHDVGLAIGFGIEWRRFRSFGIGADAEYRYLVRSRDESAGLLHVEIRASFHF